MNFNEIYSKYKVIVYNVALHYSQSIEDAEEITQDVFVSLFEKVQFFREDASLKTWIYKITVNKSLDFLRAKKRQKRFAFITSIFTPDSIKTIEIPTSSHPGIELEEKENLNRLFNCINKLSENQKTVIILLKVEQISQKETAEIMGLTTKAVESLFQRAKNNLKSHLQNEGLD